VKLRKAFIFGKGTKLAAVCTGLICAGLASDGYLFGSPTAWGL
jgi:hypothetical protein